MSRRGYCRLTPAVLALSASFACSGAPEESTATRTHPRVTAAQHGVSAPIMLLRPAAAAVRWQRPRRLLPRVISGGRADAVTLGLEAAPAPLPSLSIPLPLATFEGIGEGFVGKAPAPYLVSGAPADPVGDVGPNHYVQMVNTAFAVFDKSGNVLAGATDTNALFTGLPPLATQPSLSHPCARFNQGDGIVLYDPLADRWFLSQFAFDTCPPGSTACRAGDPIAPFFQCVAISKTADPAGAYNLFAFGPYRFGGADAMNDYPKFGVWPDGYYATYNMFGAVTGALLGTTACAFDRAKMLAGESGVTQQCFEIPNNGGLLPADLDGKRPPPAGSPGYVVAWDDTGGSVLQLWRFHVDWTTPASSTLSAHPDTVSVDPIALACGNASNDTCVPQPGTTTQLDALGDRLMHRLAYRNFGDHEALVASHSVRVTDAAGARSGVRWYELRNAAGGTFATAAPVLVQQGTFAPDATWRWMGSAAMDQLGDLAIGYSASSAQVRPSLRYAGRLWSDSTPGAMSLGEAVLFGGSGVQSGTSRWGDYSALTVDPADDCTFWYTNQYIPFDGAFWHTRIGKFKLPACPPAFSIQLPPAANPGQRLTMAITARDQQGTVLAAYSGTATLSTTDAAATFPATITFANGAATADVTFFTLGAHTVTVADPFSPNLTGRAGTSIGPGSVAVAPPTIQLTVPHDGDTVSGALLVGAQATVGSGTKLARIELLVDGALVATATSTPAQLTWDTTAVANGRHALTVRIVDALDGSATAAIGVDVENTKAPSSGGSGGATGSGSRAGSSGGTGSGGGCASAPAGRWDASLALFALLAFLARQKRVRA
jgi:uncharacterized membrane protein YgcG